MSAAVGSALRPRHWAGFAAVAVLLSLWPSRAALLAGEIPGAGPDVVSTTWGMWWFSQTLGGAAWGEATDLVNVPYGAYGSVLAPVTAAAMDSRDPTKPPISPPMSEVTLAVPEPMSTNT